MGTNLDGMSLRDKSINHMAELLVEYPDAIAGILQIRLPEDVDAVGKTAYLAAAILMDYADARMLRNPRMWLAETEKAGGVRPWLSNNEDYEKLCEAVHADSWFWPDTDKCRADEVFRNLVMNVSLDDLSKRSSCIDYGRVINDVEKIKQAVFQLPKY